MTMHYSLRREVEQKCAKKLEKLNSRSSSKKSNFYLLHLLSRLWPIFGTQENGTKLVQQFCQICSKCKSSIKDIADQVFPHFSRTKSMKQLLTAFLTFILDITSVPCFQPVLFKDTLRVRFCWYGDCRTMGVGMWRAHSIWCSIPGLLLCAMHSIVMYFI